MTGGPIVVIGDVMTDVIARVEDPLALGSDTPARVVTRQGGAGANVAAWLAALGHPVAFVGCVGDDPFGREAVQVLAAAGVMTHVAVDPTAATGTCVVLVGRDGERTMLPDAGANSALSVRHLPLEAIRQAGHLHVSGYTLLNPGSRPAGHAALTAAHEAVVPTSVDAASAAPLEAVGAGEFLRLTEGVDLLICTLDEAEVLCGSRDPDIGSARLTAHYPQLLLKLGAGGALWRAADDRPGCSVPAVAASGVIVDSTGAGDAFAAAYLATTGRGGPVTDGLAAGCALAATLITRTGARP